MATPDQIPTDLTLDIEDDLAPEEFVAAVRNFFGYIKEITESQEGDGSKITWKVKVKEGSNLVGLTPVDAAPKSRLAMVYRKVSYGIDALSRGEVRGAGLSEKAITHLKGLSDIAGKSTTKNGVRIWVERRPVAIGGGISKAIREDWESDYYDFGSVEGRLEFIQDADDSIKIRIKDFLFDKPIKCVISEDKLDQVLANFRRRVELEGRIHYRRDGTPISIEADVIDALPEDEDLPTADDVRGILTAT